MFGQQSLAQPLISTRTSLACSELHETVEGLGSLERLLRLQNDAAYGPIAEALWEAESDGAAVDALVQLAEGGGQLAAWEAEVAAGVGRDRPEREAEG